MGGTRRLGPKNRLGVSKFFYDEGRKIAKTGRNLAAIREGGIVGWCLLVALEGDGVM